MLPKIIFLVTLIICTGKMGVKFLAFKICRLAACDIFKVFFLILFLKEVINTLLLRRCEVPTPGNSCQPKALH